VADQHHRAFLHIDYARGRLDVVRERGFRLLHDRHVIALRKKNLCHGLPAGTISERTVHEHDVLDVSCRCRVGGSGAEDHGQGQRDFALHRVTSPEKSILPAVRRTDLRHVRRIG
jgi:hypothetical protein